MTKLKKIITTITLTSTFISGILLVLTQIERKNTIGQAERKHTLNPYESYQYNQLTKRKNQINGIFMSVFTNQEIELGENYIFPKINSDKELISLYLESARCKNQLTVKLLTQPSISPPSEPADEFDKNFNLLWKTIEGKEFSNLRICDGQNGCSHKFYVDIDSKPYMFEFDSNQYHDHPEEFEYFGKVSVIPVAL